MANGKKSFIAYVDRIETFDALSDEQAGKLVKHIWNYVNDKNPQVDDDIVKIAFVSIKQTLKRDLRKYEEYIEKQRENGKRGGRPKNPTLSKKTQPFSEKPKKADSDSDSDSDNNNIWVEEFLQKKDGSATYHILNRIFSLGYRPAKKESIDSFREWCKQLLQNYEVKNMSDLEKVLFSFKTYREENDPGKNPNWKSKINTRFSNNLTYKKG